MPALVPHPELVAACGLYCGACRRYAKGSCPGCAGNDKATWCKVRSCNRAAGRWTCAQCETYPNPLDCAKFNNFISRTIGFVLRSNRAACIQQIRAKGLEGHAKIMAQSGRQTLPR